MSTQHGFTLTYAPDLAGGTTCTCKHVVGAVRVVAGDDGTPKCTVCVADSMPELAALVEALDEVDDALYDVDGTMIGAFAQDALDLTTEILRQRIPTGARPEVPHELFMPALVDRLVRAEVDPEEIVRIAQLVDPEIDHSALRRIFLDNQAEAVAAAGVAELKAAQAQAALTLMGRAQTPANLGDAVEQLGVDFGIFLGALLDAASEHGCSVADLSRQVVDDALTAAGCGPVPGEPHPSIA